MRKVSIITVCFNSEKTIERTIKSVLNQTYSNIEYIIIDGKSTDRTLKIVENYSKLFGDRMIIVSEPDKGIYDAMNKGIKIASGELIGLVNSDDFYEVDAVENAVSSFDSQNKYQVIYGFQRCLNNGNEEKIVFFNHNFLDKQMITHPTCFVSKAVYDRYGVFDLRYKSSSDYEFMLRLFHNSETVFKPIYKIISNFETGGMSSSEVSVRETAKLHLQYKTISKLRYVSILLRSYIHAMIT